MLCTVSAYPYVHKLSVYKEHFNPATASSDSQSKMKVAVIIFGTLATAIFLAEAGVVSNVATLHY